MEYYKILNLQKEPFSNSPEPDFFYQSEQHLACLQKLELAIRLRRGLNVIIGEVGTGKTTLCRQIILRFSRSDDDRKQIETHLIMDPSFSDAQQFLATVAKLLGVKVTKNEANEWQLKENIKNYLFKKGIDEGKIVVLIIDEGQKLPSFCLEILREFLNYETTEYKLLQIVIFAQREFEPLLQAHANFADRINEYSFLPPLNFKNTRNMIKFRIARASANPSTVPSLFSLPAKWAIYRSTKGYPRKIIALCHQAILATIIQNRTKAGFFLVRSCADRVNFGCDDKAVKWKWPFIIAAGLMIVILLAAYGKVALLNSWKEGGTNIARHTTGARFFFLPSTDDNIKPSNANAAKPKILGQLTLKKSADALTILKRIYGTNARMQVTSFLKANPRVTNPDEVKAGETIIIPARSDIHDPTTSARWWIQIATLKDLAGAYELVTAAPSAQSFVMLSYWNQREGLTFAILLNKGFKDEAAAKKALKALPPPYHLLGRVVSGWGNDSVFL